LSFASSSLPICLSTHATTPEIYTLSLHYALPIFRAGCLRRGGDTWRIEPFWNRGQQRNGERKRGDHGRAHCSSRLRPRCRGCARDRKSTRLNSSHVKISYAVFCLKKKNEIQHSKA